MIYVFGDYELDTDSYELRRRGIPLQIEPKVFDLLSYLIQHHDQLVSKEVLHEHLWPDQFVSESALTYCVTAARKAVGDSGRAQRVIKTLYGRGYRFIAPLLERDSVSDASLPSDLPAEREALPASHEEEIDSGPPPLEQAFLAAERRQLTVMWCRVVVTDLLSERLDPEELYELIQEAHRVCAGVIHRFEGHIAQRFGDGLMVYFGYPRAHEDDAYRAVCTGLEVVEEMRRLNKRLEGEKHVKLTMRVGIHTSMVVMQAVDRGDKREQLVSGDTPHIVAQLPGLAAPDTVVVSSSTLRLVENRFVYQNLGTHLLEEQSQPLAIYEIQQKRDSWSKITTPPTAGMTPFVGRKQELGLLRERWQQAREGQGQVILLSGEAGIGKSRLVQVPQERMAQAAQTRIECRCSPYYQNSAFFPVVDYLKHWLQWQLEDSSPVKLDKLENALAPYGFVLDEVVPIFASLLSLPLPDRYRSIMTPQRQKQRTLETLLAWFLKETEQRPVYFVMEDLHWADPSTLELLGLLIDQIHTARMLLLLTFRPHFSPAWPVRSHVSHITLGRFTRQQVDRMIKQVTRGKPLPPEVVEQLMVKSDGVPLFVEEMTRMVLESGLVKETDGRYELTGPLPLLAIPSTLHDSLMARLDRLGVGKQVAQLSATLGREFSYDLIHAVALMEESTLQWGLTRLVEAELLHQRGFPPQARYTFKHALIQDAAYQSLLRRTRQRYHREVAQVLEQRFPDIRDTQPELMAHHYTEAGLRARAVDYWQQAAQRDLERSAHLDAIAHARRGLAALSALTDLLERRRCELSLQTMLGVALTYTRGHGAPEVARAFARARELSELVGDVQQLFNVFRGMWLIYFMHSELSTASELGDQLLRLAQGHNDPALLVESYRAVSAGLFFLGEQTAVVPYLERGLTLHDTLPKRPLPIQYGQDTDIMLLLYTAMNQWLRGYPDQSQQTIQQMLRRSQSRAHYNRCHAFVFSAFVHQWRGEIDVVHERVEASIALAHEYVLPMMLALGRIFRGWVLAQRGQYEDGIVAIRRGITDYRAMGAELALTCMLAMLIEVYLEMGDIEAALHTLADAFALVDKNGERWWEAELYRLQAELLLRQATPDVAQAKAALHKALTVARRQEVKSLELRAAMSLCRLWRQQEKGGQVCDQLKEIYSWFCEGYHTADLKAAKALLRTVG